MGNAVLEVQEWGWNAGSIPSVSLLTALISAGVCHADAGAQRLPGAAPGEGGGDLRAESRAQQHPGKPEDPAAGPQSWDLPCWQ